MQPADAAELSIRRTAADTWLSSDQIQGLTQILFESVRRDSAIGPPPLDGLFDVASRPTEDPKAQSH